MPTNAIGWWPIMWLFSATLVIAGLTLGLWSLANRVDVPRAGVFVGTLRPERNPVVIRLPAGTPLLSVLVEPGEHVRKGQTVALLDQALIESRLVQIDREIRAAGLFRECLINRDGISFETLRDAEFDAETKLLVRAGLEECQVMRHDLEQRQERIADVRALVGQRLGLLERKMTVVLTAQVDSTEQAHVALDIALQKNLLQERVALLEAELQSVKSAFDDVRIARQKQTAQDVAAMRHQKAVLIRYNQTPRLTAPQSGEVARVRPLMAGNAYGDAEDLLELHDERHDAFEAEFSVSLLNSYALREGAEVHLSLLGYPEDGPVLGGVISALHAADPEQGETHLSALIELDDASLARLSDPAGGIALKGRSTASAIHVTLSKTSLRHTLQDALMDTIPMKNIGFWTAPSRFLDRIKDI